MVKEFIEPITTQSLDSWDKTANLIDDSCFITTKIVGGWGKFGNLNTLSKRFQLLPYYKLKVRFNVYTFDDFMGEISLEADDLTLFWKKFY